MTNIDRIAIELKCPKCEYSGWIGVGTTASHCPHCEATRVFSNILVVPEEQEEALTPEPKDDDQ